MTVDPNFIIDSQGGGLGIPTDRNQRSCVFLNDPKNTLPLKKPKKILSKN